MQGRNRNRTSDWQAYFHVTRSGTYGFLAALPLWAAYEVLILLANSTRLGEIRVSADIWIKRVLSSFGVAGLFGLGIAVLLAGIAVFYWERKRNLPIRPRYLFMIPLESAVYAIALGWVVGTAIGLLFAIAPPQMSQFDGPTQLALSLGAGLYEELVFRVLLVGALFWIFRKFSDKSAAYLSAALIGAAIFSAVHYVGPFGDPFSVSSFAFRFFFGLLLNGLYILRGFGVVAWTHALYDVSIVVGFWG